MESSCTGESTGAISIHTPILVTVSIGTVRKKSQASYAKGSYESTSHCSHCGILHFPSPHLHIPLATQRMENRSSARTSSRRRNISTIIRPPATNHHRHIPHGTFHFEF